MKTIWKFPLAIVSLNSVRMPKGAEILSVQMQGDTPCLWAMVEPEEPHESRYIEILGTGQPIHDNASRSHIGTFQQGRFVWHVFERVIQEQVKS